MILPNPKGNIMFGIMSVAILLILVLMEIAFTIMTLIYFIAKIVTRWLFYYEKPTKKYSKWWLQNSPLFSCACRRNFTPMTFERIGELWVIKFNIDKWFDFKWPNSPFEVVVMSVTIPFIIGVMHSGADDPVLNYFRISGVVIYVIWIIFIKFKLLFWSWKFL